MDVPPGEDSTLPSKDIPPGWARIELEPVNIPLEQNESILLSSVQSVIPGAHGLYYKEDNRKRALKYDSTTGCILKGPPGWNSKPIYVVLAHGCRYFNSIAVGQYDAATERFEKTANFIQRILTDRNAPSYLHRKDISNRSTDRKGIGDRLSRDAQISGNGDRENRADEEEQIDGSFAFGKSSKTSIDIQKPQEENDISKQSDLRIHPSTYNIGKEERARSEDVCEKLKRQKEKAENELIEKERKVNDLEQIISDLELKLNEHKQSSDVTQARVKDLEIMLDDERNKAQSLANLNAELNTKIENFSLAQQSDIENDRLKLSREELDKKNYEIDNLNMQINDLKWSLGEHKQWLKDANDRANHFENMCKEKDYIIDDLTNRLHGAERRIVEIPIPKNTENLNSLIDDLRNQIDKKNNYIDQLEKTKNEAQWHLGEHQHWLQDANNRIDVLENEKSEVWRKVRELEERLHQVEPVAAAVDYNQTKAKMEELQQTMKNKNREYEKLNEQKNEMDVNLGEHKVWLEDAKKRIKYLEDEGTENDHFILDINKELGELKEVRIDAFQQLHEKIDDLELCLSKKINESEFGNDNLEYKQLKRSVKDLGRNISDENIDLNNLSKLKNNGECNFEEQWSQDLKNRITELENAIQRLTNEKNAAISKLNEIEQLETNMEEINKRMLEKDQLIVQLEKKVNDKQNELNSFGWRIEELLRELNEANKNLKNCEQQKNDTEWSLGEHRQWLTDAKNKIDEIENKLEKISGENNKLREEIEELNRASVEATEGLQKEINDKNEQLNCITKQKNDAEWSFGEHRQWLKDANNRISELESALTEKNRFIEEMQKYNEEHSASGELIALQEKLQAAEKALDEAPKQEKMNELSSLVDHLQNELNNKNECIKNLEKQCNDAEWSLGEHRQWIHDSSNRIQDLEEELRKNGDCIKQLEREIGNQSAEISNYLATIDALNNELTGKNVCIGDFEKAKNNAEWSLGEHRQWLQNANNRIDELAHSIEDKDREIAELRKAIEDFSHLTTVDKESLENLKSKLHETEEALAKAPKPDEISALKSTIEQLRNDLDSKNVHINDLEWNFGEQRQRLQDANERIAQLEKSIITKDEIIKELRNEIDELSKKVVLDLKAALEAVQMQVQPEEAEVSVEQLMFKLQNAEQALAEYSKLDDAVSLKTENENLKELLKEKNEYIDNLVQQRNNAEWSLGEHRQWLQDCNKRANWLDDIVMIKNNEIDELRCENDRLKFDLNKVSQHGDINNLIATIENLHNEISNKNTDIDEIMKQRNEAEWKLGEHRQWLEDAKNRADQLAGKLIEKEQFLNLLLEKYPEIMKEGQNKINVALVRSEPVESDKNKLFEKIFELEEKLLETEIPAKSYEESMLKTEHEATIAKLRDDLDQKDDDLARVHKERSDAEWFLGEERQRLKDANHRIAVLEEELMHEKTKHADMLQSLKNEVFELSEKNKKLKEILAKTEVLMRNLSKDSKMTMLILEQTEGPGNLEEEFKQACFSFFFDYLKFLTSILLSNKYVQLSALLTTTQEHLAKLQTGASEFANYEDLRKVIENLNNELHQCKAENKNLMKQKNNAEWQLGEHREWLRNANNRITVLEEELMRMEEAEKRAHEVLRLENEALNQTNTQLKEDMKHLQDEIQGLLLDAKKKFEEHICCACNEVSALNRTGNSGEDLSAMSRLLENLLGELNHQKIIDNLMEQRSKAERLLEDRKETITDVYDKIVELEKQILENTLEEPLEITEM
ncbi:unnamed protein product [Onchocerca ochengi]|uniref:TDP43_N domain-containing protein n=1 Tax=Onchocerca ochengi TaxID=42157 RepID=A0A182E095_ONCOC|nr:unnamed protein product [Onchocerca ochengi]